MANTVFQIKRTTVTSRTPNTTNSSNSAFLDTGELALNLTDRKLFSSNGSAHFEVGANLSSLTLTGPLTASSSNGTNGQFLASNGTGVYWSNATTQEAVESTAIIYAIALG